MSRTPYRISGEDLMLTPAEAFALAERICAGARAAQIGPASDDIAEDREVQRQARESRHATSFEELYCTLRDIAEDWHQEAVRRLDGNERGAFTADFCDSTKAIERTFRVAVDRVKDWDY